ncbi:transmembrane protein 203 isoform X1 [Bemisia tabaci]|uniref:transmembrane protein 203 isoform X1 n=1 Tax=Bemisia tabaci TaxID=7038 RepID=UPI001947679C
MFFSIKELSFWLGVTVFELWVNILGLLGFSVLLAFRLENMQITSQPPSLNDWWAVFLPLFIADIINAYFCTIVFIRMYIKGLYKGAILRACRSFTFLFLLFLAQFFICRKLTGMSNLDSSETMAPVFVILQLLAVKACQIH